jgi:hypothetical protein
MLKFGVLLALGTSVSFGQLATDTTFILVDNGFHRETGLVPTNERGNLLKLGSEVLQNIAN